MEKKKVLIQGVKGSFHDLAAHKYFGHDIDIIECNTFSILFQKLNTNKNNYALCAIENSTVGAILPNYSLVRKSSSKIIGEIYLRIKMNLMALPNQNIEDIKEVHSHPMALLQCSEYIEKFPKWKVVESEDTALSAKIIAEENIKYRASIGSEFVAKIYGLKIFEKEIENNKLNFTRFLVLSNSSIVLEKINKVSLAFTLPHHHGSLAKILTVFSENKLNLTKIQSVPIVGEDWKYFFYVDFIFENFDSYKKSLNEIKNIAENIEILGEYTIGKKEL